MNIEAAPVLFWVVIHQDNQASSPAVPTNDTGGTDPQAGSGAAPASQSPTDTATPKTATPMDIGGHEIKFKPHMTNRRYWHGI